MVTVRVRPVVQRTKDYDKERCQSESAGFPRAGQEQKVFVRAAQIVYDLYKEKGGKLGRWVEGRIIPPTNGEARAHQLKQRLP